MIYFDINVEKFPCLVGKRVAIVDSVVFAYLFSDYMAECGIIGVPIDNFKEFIEDKKPSEGFVERVKPDGAIIHVMTRASFGLAVAISKTVPVVALRRNRDGAFSSYELRILEELDRINIPSIEKRGEVSEIIGKALAILNSKFERRR